MNTPTHITVIETPLAKSAQPITLQVDLPTWDMVTELRGAVSAMHNVEVHYPEDGTGPITSRTITPTSVSITLKGNWIIRGVRIDTGEERCYRFDSIRGYRILA